MIYDAIDPLASGLALHVSIGMEFFQSTTFKFVEGSDECRWYPGNHTVVWYRAIDDAACSDDYSVSDSYSGQNDGTSSDEDVASDLNRRIAVSPPLAVSEEP